MENNQELMQKRNVSCPDMLNVRRVNGLVYNTLPDVELHCDIYLPPETSGDSKIPVVFMIHGEAPVSGLKDTGAYVSLGEMIASSGKAAVAFNHRMLLSGSSIIEVLDDIAKARDFVNLHSAEYNIDSARTCVWAVSAGMPFGVHNALNHKPEDVRCIIGYYGFGDFQTLVNVLPGAINTAGPAHEIMTGNAGIPMLIVRSGLDHKVINDSLDRLIQRCFELNTDIDVYNHRTGNHAFDILDDNRRSHELINRSMVFLENHLVPGK